LMVFSGTSGTTGALLESSTVVTFFGAILLDTKRFQFDSNIGKKEAKIKK
jgi:hypothetical protein